MPLRHHWRRNYVLDAAGRQRGHSTAGGATAAGDRMTNSKTGCTRRQAALGLLAPVAAPAWADQTGKVIAK